VFGIYWSFVQARFARQIDDESRASLWYAWWLGLLAGLTALEVISGSAVIGNSVASVLLDLACLLCYQIGNFSIKKSIEI